MLYGSKFNLAKGNMMPLVRALASVLILFSISTCSAADSRNLMIHKGKDFSFDCCKNPNKLTTSFIIHRPNGDNYSASEGHPFVNKKVTANVSETCKVDIKEARSEDNGLWKCDVFVYDKNYKSVSVTQRYINVSLSEPQEQENNSTLYWNSQNTGQLLFVLAVVILCCVCCVFSNGQNNNAPNNASQRLRNVVLHFKGTGNALNNNDSESNSHEVTNPIAVDIPDSNGVEGNPSEDIIQTTTTGQDNTDSESNSQEDSAQNTEIAYRKSSLAITSREGLQPKFENYQKYPKEEANVDNGIVAGG